MGNNIVQQKSYEFALAGIRIGQILRSRNEFILSKQLIRSTTSIGANIEEALGGSSTKDFLHKLKISYKEARESLYWIKLLRDSELIDEISFNQLYELNQEVIKLLTAIINTTKKKV